LRDASLLKRDLVIQHPGIYRKAKIPSDNLIIINNKLLFGNIECTMMLETKNVIKMIGENKFLK
jgi:hypothetical protein